MLLILTFLILMQEAIIHSVNHYQRGQLRATTTRLTLKIRSLKLNNSKSNLLLKRSKDLSWNRYRMLPHRMQVILIYHTANHKTNLYNARLYLFLINNLKQMKLSNLKKNLFLTTRQSKQIIPMNNLSMQSCSR
ncbi:hypothetical protein MTR_3g102850 [Medicago truncatula]|uniref:Transmembrane protein n=1 Tax=Medicago truncatula TaxID=3880 RepID=A0A072V294_MEDTR|nr:hypothetical protein MTR_3g102850 [Medicago truncatula]